MQSTIMSGSKKYGSKMLSELGLSNGDPNFYLSAVPTFRNLFFAVCRKWVFVSFGDPLIDACVHQVSEAVDLRVWLW